MLFCNRNPVETSPFRLPGDASMIELASTPSKRTAFSWFALPLNRRIYEPADLRAFAARICNDARETARLSFEGSVGTFAGWRPLVAHDVCNNPAQAHYGDELP